jgi:hypothetical protein
MKFNESEPCKQYRAFLLSDGADITSFEEQAYARGV